MGQELGQGLMKKDPHCGRGLGIHGMGPGNQKSEAHDARAHHDDGHAHAAEGDRRAPQHAWHGHSLQSTQGTESSEHEGGGLCRPVATGHVFAPARARGRHMRGVQFWLELGADFYQQATDWPRA